MKNLFDQEQWARRGENDAHIAALVSRIATLEALVDSMPLRVTNCRAVAGAGSSASASFVDYPGPVDFTIQKQITNSVLLVEGTVSLYKTTAGLLMEWGVLFNGTDNFIGTYFFNVLSSHTQVYGTNFIASGVAAGTYTMRIRWATAAGTLNTDNNDRVFLTVTEWPL